MKKKFSYKLVLLLLAVFLAFPGTGYADANVSMDKSTIIEKISMHFSATSSGIQNQAMAKKQLNADASKPNLSDLNLSLSYPHEGLALGREVDISAVINWKNSALAKDTSLTGSALVYKDSANTVLFCNLFGYSGKECDDNYVTLTVTYDVVSKISKSVLTIGTDNGADKKPAIFEFGGESASFKPAYAWYSKIMTGASEKAVQVESKASAGLKLANLAVAAASTGIDSKLYHRQTITSDYGYGETHSFSLYSQKEMSESGFIKVYGKSGCNTANAKKYIVGKIDRNAWAVVPAKLEMVLRVRLNGLELRVGSQDPVDNDTSFSINIPLPLGQGFDVPVTLASTKYTRTRNSAYSGSYHIAKWNFYDINGINELNTSASNLTSSKWYKYNGGVATQVEMVNASVDVTKKTTRYIDGYSKLSFHYLYIDSTGNTNNTFWTTTNTTADQSVVCFPSY